MSYHEEEVDPRVKVFNVRDIKNHSSLIPKINIKMNSSYLNKLSYSELKGIAKTMDIPTSKTKKADLIHQISTGFKSYERHKKSTVDRYKKISSLGSKGKDGTVYLVEDTKTGERYAMKTFRKNKSTVDIKTEVKLQKLAGDMGISPKIVKHDTVFKFIVMEKLDTTLLELMQNHNGSITSDQQKQIITIFDKLDDIGVLHGDPNPLNFMEKGGRLYILDYGFAKKINRELITKYGDSRLNRKIMTMGLVLKLKEMGCPDCSYSHLLRYISRDDKERIGL